MDPNKCWDEILIDISLLYDLLTDKDYARAMQEFGEVETPTRKRLVDSLNNLSEWIEKGGFPPKPM